MMERVSIPIGVQTMKRVNKALIFAAVILLSAFVITSLSAHEQPDHVVEHADRADLQTVLWACKYIPHAISDSTWEMYRQGMIPRNTAVYWTKMMRSQNLDPGNCLKESLSPRWKGRNTRWNAPD